MKKLAVALIGLTLCASARAEFFSGNDLLSKMNSDSYIEKSQALGYVQGVFDLGQRIFHCAPNGPGITARQIHDMVKSYIELVPETRHHAADSLVITVLAKAWPCPNRGGNPA